MEVDKKNSFINITLGTEHFAISVYKVLEIIQYEELTIVPGVSDFVLGILNFRGSIVPVINMHQRFNMKAKNNTGKMIVVVDIINKDKHVLMGLLVDEVTDVVEFDYKSIKSVPDLGVKYNPEYIDGFIENNNKFIMVLNIDRVLNVKELSEITNALT